MACCRNSIKIWPGKEDQGLGGTTPKINSPGSMGATIILRPLIKSGKEMTQETAPSIDYSGKKLGMWLFLYTELLFFGGMFLLYSIFRYQYAQDFHHAAAEENRVLGSINTLLLLTSSLTMALSITAIKKGNIKLSVILQGLTVVLGLIFLADKYFEWGAKISLGLYPNSPTLLKKSHGEVLFFGLYFLMTGIHGLHVAIGIVVITFMLTFTLKKKITGENCVKLENTGLYWHFVDVIWIYLFPLFYLLT
jgi:cytochrome c oxidase subunit III